MASKSKMVLPGGEGGRGDGREVAGRGGRKGDVSGVHEGAKGKREPIHT